MMAEPNELGIPKIIEAEASNAVTSEPGGFKVKKWGIILGAVAVLAIGGFLIFEKFYQGLLVVRQYEDVYTLVSDKISQSAAIAVRLPRGMGVSVAEAKDKITFSPTLAGDWSSGPSAEYLVFTPKAKLDLGKYYSVTLTTASAKIQKDFLADEDPKVIAVFPDANSETSEYSKITVVFNRPMVPLTTLDELAKENIPVEVSPATPGQFKWITTRNLQFIPKDRLKRSANYMVKINAGFVSMDGLTVAGATYKFNTHPLRYNGTTPVPAPQILYDEPVRIMFNQPIDLDRTINELSLTKADGLGNIPFVASYGTRSLYDSESGRYQTYLDKSILEIYNKSDRFGREKLWDFNSSYAYTLKKVYPLEGDIILDEARSGSFAVGDIVAGLSAESSRSKFVEANLFDPEGKLWINFFEDIDKDKSQITADHLKEIGYGEKCKEPALGETVPYGNNCEKVADHKKIYLTFDPRGLGQGEQLQIHLKRLYNTSGLQINAEEIKATATIFPALVIYKTIPGEGAVNADLTKLIICSSNPLQIPDEKTFYNRIKSNVTVGLWNWNAPYRVQAGTSANCAVGQFENRINFGLVPQFQYTLAVNAVDDFSQAASQTVHFTSGKLADFSRRFFSLQKRYNVTSPERLKFAYATDNLEYVNLDICEVAPETMLRYIENNPDPETSSGGLNCVRTIDKRIELPKQYWSRVYFQVNLADYLPNPIGHYVLSFGHPDYRKVTTVWDPALRKSVPQVGGPVYERTFVTVTQLAVQEKKIQWNDSYYNVNRAVVADALSSGPKDLYWVSSFGSLDPVPDAAVSLYKYSTGSDMYTSSRALELAGGTYHTGTDGVALTDVFPNLAAAIVKKGDDSAIVAESVDRLQWGSPAVAVERSYLYTDKPIYRPSQQVLIKGIYRLGYDANYQIPEGKQVTLHIRDSKYEDVYQKSVVISNYGTFTADFTLDKNAPLGTYSISTPGGTAYFDVQEYVPAAFRVDAASDKAEFIAGDTMKLDVTAAYYFGVPVDGGSVEYSIASQDYYFDRYQDEYFQFGNGWYYSFDGYYNDKFIARGKVDLDTHGKAAIIQALDFSKLFKGDEGARSKIFTVNITVKNRNGQSISTQKSVVVHRGEIYAGISLNNYFVGKGNKVTARFKTVDTQGKPVSVGRVDVEIKKISWESFKRQEVDGAYYYETKEKKETVQKFNVATDQNGNAAHDFSLNDEGEYEIDVTSKDQKGNTVMSLQNLYVSGPGIVSVRPTNNETLDLATDKGQVDVGDNVKIVIKSPYPRAKALVSLERGKIFSYQIVDVNQSLTDYTFTVKDEFVPNIYASVLLLSPRPEIKFGQINYKVNTTERELDIVVKSNKNNYLPGEAVHIDLFAKDKHGNPVSGEISVAVVDMSVLALKGNPKKTPVAFFFAGTPLAVSTQSNIKNILYEADIPVGTKGGGGGEDLAIKKRGVFKDTAFWEGVVKTDASGHAAVSFTLPDNLTTWQVESVGVTKDTKLGVGYGEFKTQKDLMVIPLKPRFIVPGDTFSLGAQIFNNTDSRENIRVLVSSNTLRLPSDTTTSLTLAPHSDKTVYFAAAAPEAMQDGAHAFEFSASASGLEDTVAGSIPITRNDTYETTATAGYTNNAESTEYIYLPPNVTVDRGGLQVKSSATLAVFLSDALNYLAAYPYGCSEQIASKLSALAILKHGLSLKNIGDAFTLNNIVFDGNTYAPDDVVRIGLARLYQNQTTDGGFAYYQGMAPNFYLTLDVVNALVDLKNAGYDVDMPRLHLAADFLYRELTQKTNLITNRESVILTTYALARVNGYVVGSDLTSRVTSYASDAKYISEDISNISLAYLTLLLTQGYPKDLKEKVFQQLENRIVIDARGAYLSMRGRASLYEYYETPIKDTALLLKAFAKDERDSAVLDKVLRWILASRAKDGAWGSTNNTVTVIDALTDFLVWKKENLSSFNLATAVGGKSVGEFVFSGASVLRQFEKFIPTVDIGLGKIQKVTLTKTNQNAQPNNYYYDMMLKYYLPIEKIPPRDEGFAVSREFYAADDTTNGKPLSEAKQGDVLRGHLVLTVPEARNFVSVEDFIPAGMEIVNLSLATEDQSLQTPNQNQNYYDSGASRDYGPSGFNRNGGSLWSMSGLASVWSSIRGAFNFSTSLVSGVKELPDNFYSKDVKITGDLFPDSSELHDDRLFLFKEHLNPGVYQYDYFVRALVPGVFRHLPAVASEMYFPENFGRTRGETFAIKASE